MWPFTVNSRVLELNRKLKGAAKVATDLRAQLAEANAAVAEMQRKQQRAKETYDRIRAVEQDLTVQRIAELDDLRDQVDDLRQQLLEASAVRQELARERRRWDGHAAVCPVAQQLDDVDRDKARSSE